MDPGEGLVCSIALMLVLALVHAYPAQATVSIPLALALAPPGHGTGCHSAIPGDPGAQLSGHVEAQGQGRRGACSSLHQP